MLPANMRKIIISLLLLCLLLAVHFDHLLDGLFLILATDARSTYLLQCLCIIGVLRYRN